MSSRRCRRIFNRDILKDKECNRTFLTNNIYCDICLRARRIDSHIERYKSTGIDLDQYHELLVCAHGVMLTHSLPSTEWISNSYVLPISICKRCSHDSSTWVPIGFVALYTNGSYIIQVGVSQPVYMSSQLHLKEYLLSKNVHVESEIEIFKSRFRPF